MADILWMDLETQSACDMDRGNYHYAKHPTTSFVCMAYAFNDDPVELWTPAMGPVPEHVIYHIGYGRDEVWAHNAIFERIMLKYCGLRLYGIVPPEIEQMVCTMIMCANRALPLSLENAGIALCLPERKDMEKRKDMLKISKPLSTDPITGEPVFATPESHPKEFQNTYDYCIGDVILERAIAKQLKRISPLDRRAYCMDQRMNDKGMKVDIPTVHVMKRLATKEYDRLNEELQPICGLNFTQVAKIGSWVRAHGIEVPSLDKHDMTSLLRRTDLPSEVRRVLEIRQEGAKSSVGKLDAMLRRCEDDHRARGCFQFKGAVSTGRWAHREVQSGNLPVPKLSPQVISVILDWLSTCKEEDDLETLETIRIIWGRPMQVFSDCLRGLLIPEAGKVFIAPDLVSIESLVAAWLVGDDAKVTFMGAGGDVYKEIARLVLGLAPFRGWDLAEGVPVTKAQRQAPGKIVELACGYQGGHKEDGAIGTYCTQNDVPYPGEATAKRWVDVWREYHPHHVRYWKEVNEAAINAVLHPGSQFSLGPKGRRVSFRVDGRFLLCRLPSGSELCYPFPRIENTRFGPCVTYMKSKDKRWFRNKYYGGHGLENNTQAVAKDLLVHGMLNLEDDRLGTPVNCSHDEAVAEVDEDTPQALVEASFTRRPEWAHDLPYRSSSFKAKRYQK